EHIFAATGGVPRRINTLVDRVLLSGYLAEKHRIVSADVTDAADEQARELGTKPGLDPAASEGNASEGSSMFRHALRGPNEAADASRTSNGIPSRLDALENRVSILE